MPIFNGLIELLILRRKDGFSSDPMEGSNGTWQVIDDVCVDWLDQHVMSPPAGEENGYFGKYIKIQIQ